MFTIWTKLTLPTSPRRCLYPSSGWSCNNFPFCRRYVCQNFFRRLFNPCTSSIGNMLNEFNLDFPLHSYPISRYLEALVQSSHQHISQIFILLNHSRLIHGANKMKYDAADSLQWMSRKMWKKKLKLHTKSALHRNDKTVERH